MPEEPAEARIRAAMQQLLAGPIPDNLKCDIKSLCILAGIPRATFYRTYPYLKAEFDQQRNAAQQTGQQPDPRLARIQRLKAELDTLRQRLNTTNTELANLKQLQAKALSQIAAQHNEITTLRQRLDAGPTISTLMIPGKPAAVVSGPYSGQGPRL
jgi:predicted nuclease with TOPRIM domain